MIPNMVKNKLQLQLNIYYHLRAAFDEAKTKKINKKKREV